MLLAWVVTINSTRNEEFLAKTLEDQQKVCCIYEIDKHIWCPWSLCHMEIYISYLNGGSINQFPGRFLAWPRFSLSLSHTPPRGVQCPDIMCVAINAATTGTNNLPASATCRPVCRSLVPLALASVPAPPPPSPTSCQGTCPTRSQLRTHGSVSKASGPWKNEAA